MNTGTAIAENTSSKKDTNNNTINSYADILLRTNPDGIMIVTGASYQQVYQIDPHYNIPSHALKIGGEIGINPSYGQFSLYGEWVPLLFLKIRFQYDKYAFLGQYGGLLSFSSANQPFGKNAIENREGDEESTTGDRLMLQPLLHVKIDQIILREKITFARYWFDGKGPYFHESEYDTLLENDDTLFANELSLFYEFKPINAFELFAGPYYEWIHAESSKLTRQQVGVNLFLSKTGNRFEEHHFYARFGVNIEDHNREGEGFFLIGYGLNF